MRRASDNSFWRSVHNPPQINVQLLTSLFFLVALSRCPPPIATDAAALLLSTTSLCCKEEDALTSVLDHVAASEPLKGSTQGQTSDALSDCLFQLIIESDYII
jgi:hypothetical protein